MKTKNVLYAAVGAPVVAARKVGSKANDVYGKLNEQASGYSKTAGKTIDGWAVEGEKVVVSVKERKVVDEITAKVDLDQAKEQVGKLRDQLEDMLATWRSSFRPENTEVTDAKKSEAKATATPTKATATKATATRAAATKTTSKASTAGKPAAKSATSKASAAKTTTAKTSPEKDTPADKADKAS